MSVPVTRPLYHTQTTLVQYQIIRSPAWYFAPPVPSAMREPGTNFYTLITANGPHTTERP